MGGEGRYPQRAGLGLELWMLSSRCHLQLCDLERSRKPVCTWIPLLKSGTFSFYVCHTPLKGLNDIMKSKTIAKV
jgi:hypothetical protein